ncbi:hypothetical protein A2972_05000 [Candidatus Amesbacteria bacterium RIFCSPLOWO2_01_FULL_47_33]|uniref:Uncharacterized protein n=1 Tax=Candidatus Amesbacteria bacterium RIFCSPLOWO2_01_FULL_47_33 TaxID=1797258 RepID=A0A1F4Z201_9BACT|nr:MAG: hypothetical protein A2972_05000 [Candidatus Amesbacteria bacterium RIFCSPLOWO2_01_FULL_47_33]
MVISLVGNAVPMNEANRICSKCLQTYTSWEPGKPDKCPNCQSPVREGAVKGEKAGGSLVDRNPGRKK